MTRIGVFSDTHGHFANLPAALAKAGALDMILHLGDFGGDAERIANELSVPFHAVRGNCDLSGAYPKEYVATVENASLFMTHGDRYADIYRLSAAAEQQHCQAALFGHTHVPLLTAQGPLLIVNPGSLSRPHAGCQPSFAVLTVEGSDVDVKIHTL